MKEENRDFLINVGIALFTVFIIEGCILMMYRREREIPVVEKVIVDTVYVEIPVQWSKLVNALISVESEGKEDAVNAVSGATGILQLMPIYVADANRIIGEERFTLEDRLSAVKSLEMFEIIQGHYNPDKDIEKAIFLHNPRGGKSYRDKVLSRI